MRIINNSDRAGDVSIDAIDDEGETYEPIPLSLEAKGAAHFNSADLENGNPEKGLSEGVGTGSGNWRLVLTTDLDLEPLAYIRTTDGFFTDMHEVAAETEDGSNRYHVPFFNPGTNESQLSSLRLINPGDSTASIEITGVDDRGRDPPSGSVRFTLSAGTARTLSARHLEGGTSGVTGHLGAGEGKWRLRVSADRPIQVMSLLDHPTGHLTNLSRGRERASVETPPPPPPPPPPSRPDLVVQSPSVSNSSPYLGQPFTLSVTVRNQGNGRSAATTVRFHHSVDTTISRTDTELYATASGALAPSGARTHAITVTARSAAGTYYFGACVDAVSGESNSANNCSVAVRVTVSAPSSYWGALATGWLGGTCESAFAWAATWNYFDRNSAASRALQNCQAAGLLGCTLRVSFEQCGSLAHGESSSGCDIYGASGATRSAAEQNALARCLANYSDCKIPTGTSGNRATYCNRDAGTAKSAGVQFDTHAAGSPLEPGNSDLDSQARPVPTRP